MFDEDVSQIRPEDVKTEDEGKGKMYAAIGKEIDEHNILGKEQARKNFLTKGCVIGFILIIVTPIIMLLMIMIVLPIVFSKFENDPNYDKVVTKDRGGYSIEYKLKPGSTEGPK